MTITLSRKCVFAFKCMAAMLGLIAVLTAFEPTRRAVVYPALWHTFLTSLFSPIVERAQIDQDQLHVNVVIEMEEGQQHREAALQAVIDQAVEDIEYAWGPFDAPVKVRLSNGFTFFDKYQASIVRLPSAFAYYDTLFLVAEADSPLTEGSLYRPRRKRARMRADPTPLEAYGKTEPFDRLAIENYRRVVTHEMTHLRMYQLMSPDSRPWLPFDVPRWFVEGMAQYTDGERMGNMLPNRIFDFHDQFPKVDLANGGQVYFNRDASVAYGVSFYMFDALVRNYGRNAIQDTFTAMRAGQNFNQAWYTAFAITRADLEAQLLAELFGNEPAYQLSRDWLKVRRDLAVTERMCQDYRDSFPPEMPQAEVEMMYQMNCTEGLESLRGMLQEIGAKLPSTNSKSIPTDAVLGLPVDRLRPGRSEGPNPVEIPDGSARQYCDLSLNSPPCPALHPLVMYY